MAEGRGYQILQAMQRRWRLEGALYCLLLALTVGFPVGLLVFVGWGILAFVIALGIACWIFPHWRMSMKDVSRWLDRTQASLEESSGLLLRAHSELGTLERLQVMRLEGRMDDLRPVRPLGKRIWWAMGLVAVSIASSYWIFYNRRFECGVVTETLAKVTGLKEKVAPGVKGVRVRVIPPAYTGKAVREQENFNLQVEEGAVISWEIETNQIVEKVEFVFNDSLHVKLSGGEKDWKISMPGARNGFYQVSVNDKLSPLYKLELIHDEPPRIVIRKPKPYTVIDYGEPRKPLLEVDLQDDYGIADAGISATIASGSGEAVKFKEQTLRFETGFSAGRREYDLHRVLDLDALGMKPGDELYFFCKAKDNHGQESRSDMYIISLPDTAQLMRIDGLTMGLDIKPELFRSERQIIIETEQLLRARDTISAQAFKDKANSLGIDQKLLRLRYGKFLGEEAEEGDAGEGFAAAGGSPADFSNAEKVRDAFTDKHDNSEDATFFEPAVKAQLKATLTEMWNAELKLRTFQVQDALPFEYKALRLLKDLQQKSRAFVAKTGVKLTPLDPKKRLTGQLDVIQSPRRHIAIPSEIPDEEILRMSLGVLEVNISTPISEAILTRAMRLLSTQASLHPGEYLEGYQAMRRITAGGKKTGDEVLAEKAIRRALPGAEMRPSMGVGSPDAGLSNLYFDDLKSRRP